MSITIITSTGKRISYEYNAKSGRTINVDGITFLVCKFSGGWRVLAPHLSSSYFMANKPYVYKTRREAVDGVTNNIVELKLHIQAIKVECGEQVTTKDIKKEEVVEAKPIANILYLKPTNDARLAKFGTILIWSFRTNSKGEAKLDRASQLHVDVDVWDQEVANVEHSLKVKGYDLDINVADHSQVNYKKKMASFGEWCHGEHVEVIHLNRTRI